MRQSIYLGQKFGDWTVVKMDYLKPGDINHRRYTLRAEDDLVVVTMVVSDNSMTNIKNGRNVWNILYNKEQHNRRNKAIVEYKDLSKFI